MKNQELTIDELTALLVSKLNSSVETINPTEHQKKAVGFGIRDIETEVKSLKSFITANGGNLK